MKGPIAPKDPTGQRPGFYVLLDKEVGGIPQDDGAGRHPIYLGDTRLTTLARVTGGIQDPDLLKLLTTAEGFRTLVHSVGVSVSASRRDLSVSFSLDFSGAEGEGSGSSFPLRFPADGQERLLVLDALDWSGRERAPGAFQFSLPTAEDLARATVKLYVNDGFSVPQVDPDPPVDLRSPAYREMIARSLLSAGNNCRVKRFLDKARAGEDVTVAFLGGSITQGAGAVPLQEMCYARRTWEGLRERFGGHIRYIKAGVGGTPSETGLMRYARDITRDGSVRPDLVVV